jgi:hypothetical protein
MRRRTVLKGLVTTAVGTYSEPALRAMQAASSPSRRFLVYVSPHLPQAVRDSAQKILNLKQPLLRALSEDAEPVMVDPSNFDRNTFEQFWYSHAVLVGLPNDPILRAAWQREARPEQGGFYIFGFGYLRGDIGYVESDRSPFLHSAFVRQAPFETQVITVTGSTPAGVQLAIDALMRRSLVNGIVAAPGWVRPRPCLLDRDPLSPDYSLPEVPVRISELDLIGWTQASEDEYRGVLADCGVLPDAIWRAKYYRRGFWDSPGAAGSFDNYAAGLHRRAYGNTMWVAQFSTESAARSAATRIAGAAHLHSSGTERWEGDQLSYASNMYPGESKVQGSLTVTRVGRWVQMLALQQRAS